MAHVPYPSWDSLSYTWKWETQHPMSNSVQVDVTCKKQGLVLKI